MQYAVKNNKFQNFINTMHIYFSQLSAESDLATPHIHLTISKHVRRESLTEFS